jgi:hypothetical protein
LAKIALADEIPNGSVTIAFEDTHGFLAVGYYAVVVYQGPQPAYPRREDERYARRLDIPYPACGQLIWRDLADLTEGLPIRSPDRSARLGDFVSPRDHWAKQDASPVDWPDVVKLEIREASSNADGPRTLTENDVGALRAGHAVVYPFGGRSTYRALPTYALLIPWRGKLLYVVLPERHGATSWVYYPLFPITVTFDLVTFPIQGVLVVGASIYALTGWG